MCAMSLSSFLRYLLLPATSFTVLVFIAVLSLGFALALHAGFLGLAMAVLLSLWLFNYGFVLLEAIANGAREPPVLAIEMLNPVHERRPMILVAIVFLATFLLALVARYEDARLALALGIVVFVALPASTGALAVGSSRWQAVNPLVLWHIVRSLKFSYAAIVSLVLLYGVVDWQLLRSDLAGWSLLDSGLLDLRGWGVTAWTVFAWLSLFTLIGGSLYEHRLELGHDAADSPERRDERRQAETEREHARFLDRVHGQARGGNLAGAWATIEHELTEQHHCFETYDWLLDALSDREDVRLARRLAQDYVGRALGRDNARATQIAQRGLRIDPDFRPRSAAQCLRVADLLRLAGDRQSAQSLLRDFATYFPGDPAIADAQSLLATLRGPPAVS
jgi:hypothetical protein